MSVRRRRQSARTLLAVSDVPVRTCVGCRRRDVQETLLRVVAVGPAPGSMSWTVEPDPRRRSAGRGAYVHPDPGCVRSADQRRAFQRALRRSAPPDIGPLHSWLEHQQA